jgi:hypothetical protein
MIWIIHPKPVKGSRKTILNQAEKHLEIQLIAGLKL